MSRWTEEFENHPLHETIRQSQTWLTDGLNEPDENAAIEHRRLKKALDALEAVLRAIDPELAPISLLNQVNQHLRHQNFWNQLSSFSSSHNTAHLTNANNHISAQFQAIYQLSALAGAAEDVDTVKSLESAYDEFCGTLSGKSATFENELSEGKNRLEKLAAERDVLVKDLAQLQANQSAKLAEWQEQFTADQTQRATEYSDKQIERDKAYSKWLAEFKTTKSEEISKEEKSWNDRINSHFAKFKKMIDEFQADADEKHKAILDMHGLVAEDSVAGGYKQLADHERDQANLWRRVAVGFITATVLWLGLTYWRGVQLDADGAIIWAEIAKIASLTAVLLFGAVFASKQSNLHRESEKKTRWFALEVKAIGPFISSLDDTAQKDLKAKFSERLFAQNNGEAQNSNPDANFDPNALKVVGSLVKDIASAVK